MINDDLQSLEPLHVPAALVQHLGRVTRPGDLVVAQRATVLMQQGKDEAVKMLHTAQLMLETERQSRSAQHAAEFADLLLRQSDKIDSLKATLQAELASQLDQGVCDVLRRMGLSLSPTEAISAAASALVAQFSHLDQPVLQVCPDDLASLEAAGGIKLPSGWRLEGDAAIDPGGCRLRTDQGSVSCNFPALLVQVADWMQAQSPARSEEDCDDPEAHDE